MKKILTSVFFILSAIVSMAQKTAPTRPEFPMDSEGKTIEYKGIIELSGVTKSELYKRGYNWIKSYYVNPTQVIQTADSVSGKIEGKAQFATSKILKNGVKAQADMVKYNITLDIKDGKYRYTITRINLQAPSFKGIETYFSETDPLVEEHFSTLTQADEMFTKIIGFLREGMEKPSVNVKKDEW